ncbi:uncharacterized protein LOC121199673 isoform X2 [Toxotes jaculatrix]|uniref:uncharacterized protein LOC121199673 isoform X2 n=1 Tax=Toxotes jaculatrix TaxID=941984 RepID=UPI001B3AE137|nr:uncharacterized protein LOC121199673 isoform X2 [Toxotes jaculatrix]
MEVTRFFQLLLLICSLFTAQLQIVSDKDIIPHGKQTESQGREPANTSDHQQGCTQDIHAVLREMSASLAEHRVEIRHIQRENEAQAAKLKELELQRTELERQKTELDKLKQQLQAQSGELITMKGRLNVTEKQVQALQRDGEVKQVAFSASLLASGEVTLGPFNTHTPLVFKHVVTNIGNAYNPNTEGSGYACAVLMQDTPIGKQPLAYYSTKLDNTEVGLPPCYQGLAAAVFAFQKASSITMGHPITLYIFHQLHALRYV